MKTSRQCALHAIALGAALLGASSAQAVDFDG